MTKEVDDAVRVAGTPVRRRGSRRVVMVSEVDAKRIEAGEFASVEEVLHATDKSQRPIAQRVKQQPKGDKHRLSAHDQAIVNEIPPHFGKL